MGAGGPHRIRVIAPSGAHRSLEAFDRACTWFSARGHEVRCDVPRTPWQRFSDDDDARLESIHEAADERGIDAVMIVRGGYGLSRLLERIDWERVAGSVRRGVHWIGYSDFTAFHLALLATKGLNSFAGPSFSGDFGHPEPDAYTVSSFASALAGRSASVAFVGEVGSAGRTPGHWAGEARGRLWGGNLSLVSGLVGTPYLPAIDGGLLFLEDVAEHPYRIERMLHQLHYAGVLKRQRAIILGAFTEWNAAPNDNGYDFATMVAYWRSRVATPIITGLPFGHILAKATLEVGRDYRLANSGDSWVLSAC